MTRLSEAGWRGDVDLQEYQKELKSPQVILVTNRSIIAAEFSAALITVLPMPFSSDMSMAGTGSTSSPASMVLKM